MNKTPKTYNEIDDYIATFSDEERQEYAVAETALNLACVLHHLRQERGLNSRRLQNGLVYISKPLVAWRKLHPISS